MNTPQIIKTIRLDHIAQAASGGMFHGRNGLTPPWLEVGLSNDGKIYYRGKMSGWSYETQWCSYHFGQMSLSDYQTVLRNFGCMVIEQGSPLQDSPGHPGFGGIGHLDL